jgi:drug/metabolite transporter (DMT)-like permease
MAGEMVLITGRAPAGQAAASLGGDLLVVLSTLLAAMGYVAGARMSQAGYASIATTLWGVAAGTGRSPAAALHALARSNSCSRSRGWSWPISSWRSGRASPSSPPRP